MNHILVIHLGWAGVCVCVCVWIGVKGCKTKMYRVDTHPSRVGTVLFWNDASTYMCGVHYFSHWHLCRPVRHLVATYTQLRCLWFIHTTHKLLLGKSRSVCKKYACLVSPLARWLLLQKFSLAKVWRCHAVSIVQWLTLLFGCRCFLFCSVCVQHFTTTLET